MNRCYVQDGRQWTALVAACCLAACTSGTPRDTVAPNAFTDGLVAIVADVQGTGWPRDDASIDSAKVVGDTLTVFTRFGGGCRPHRFALLIGHAFMESHPVQVRARLSHDAAGDMCDALLMRTLRFDLGSLKRRYRTAYGQGPAAIMINLAGVAHGLRYSFE